MDNPWKNIPLKDYESHMRLDSVRQLQVLNQVMKRQFEEYPISSAMILGVAGGNGLEHIDIKKYKRIYCVDINPMYLKEASQRHNELSDVAEWVCVDLTANEIVLPPAELVIANLLIEYIGYASFLNAIMRIAPMIVSCLIRCDADDNWVSDSPYKQVFECLEAIHMNIDSHELTEYMNGIGYTLVRSETFPLPNGKGLLLLDYKPDSDSIQNMQRRYT